MRSMKSNIFRIISVAAIASNFAVVAAEAGKPAPQPSKATTELVANVASVKLVPTKKSGEYQVIAKGHVNTPKWTNPKLEPTRDASSSTNDNMMELTFQATPPTKVGIAIVMTEVTASYRITRKAGLRGVKVRSASNSVEALFPKTH